MAEPVISNFPGALDNDGSLFADPKNAKSFTLAAGISASDTSMSVSETISPVAAPGYMIFADTGEVVHYSGIVPASTFIGLTRGADGTLAATHNAGVKIIYGLVANHYAQLKRAIIAVETELGTDPAGSAADVKTRLGASPFTIDYILYEGGGVISTGVKDYIEMPFSGTITEWRVVADAAGTIQFDIWKDTYANFPPTVADTIFSGTKPNLSTQQKNEATALALAFSAGQWLAINVDSSPAPATVKRVTLSIRGTRTV